MKRRTREVQSKGWTVKGNVRSVAMRLDRRGRVVSEEYEVYEDE
jgi:hypothetical protein